MSDLTELEPWDFAYLTGVECATGYVPGGYHPVHLGDELNSRYSVVHKLGHGTYSTVWLAQDKIEANLKAVKILTADHPTESTESKILRSLNSHQDSRPLAGRNHILSLLDEFFLTGPNGRHRCLVTDISGTSVARSCDNHPLYFFPLQVGRAIIAQVILAVQFLHSKGVVHGDLHTNNILLQFPKLDEVSTLDDLYRRIEKPSRQVVKLAKGGALGDGYPAYEVTPCYSSEPCHRTKIDACHVRVCDFGEAFLPAETIRCTLHTPRVLSPPESLIENPTEPLGTSADIWTLACTAFEILANRTLFEGLLSSADQVIGDMVGGLGYESMPPSLSEHWPGRISFVDSAGTWIGEDPAISLAQRVDDMREHDKAMERLRGEERDCFIAMLASMLKWRPEERVTADELTGCRWMQAWGLPALDSAGISHD